MIHITRKQPSSKTNYILPILVFVGILAFSQFGAGALGSIAVADPDMYMKLIPIGILVMLVVVYGFTFLTNPYFRGKRAEQRAFIQKYGKVSGVDMKGMFAVTILLSLIPLAFVGDLDRWKWFVDNRGIAMAIWGTICLIPVGLASLMMQRSSAKMIGFVNTTIPDTKLNLTGAHVGRRGSMMSFDGQFRGREIAYETESGTQENMYGKTTLKVQMRGEMPKVFADLHVTDRKPQWRTYTGATVDDVFEKRFEYTGAEVSDLPGAFKETMIRLPRAVRMEFHKNEFDFVFDGATMDRPPFYGYHGMVLFLDDMSEVADSISA